MNKIGIITYQNAINYGAALQSRALYDYLSNKYPFCSFEIINYYNSKVSNNKSFSSIIKSDKLSKSQKVKQLLGFFITLKSIRKFKKFLSNVKYSKEYNKENIQEVENKYDYFIIGSDQVWNYKLNNNDDTYLLPFVKDKKRIYTYASSLGLSSIDKNHEKIFKDNIKYYNSISVREKEAKDILNEIIKREITVVLDPVFLVDMNYWYNMINNCNKNKNCKKTVAYYVFNHDYISIANNISKDFMKKDYSLCKMNGKVSIKDYLNKKIIVGKSFGPKEFVQTIYNSDMVLTDSFHCVALSIIFHKKFIVFLDEKVMETNSRMRNLLKICNLEFLIYSEDMKIDEIDWSLVDKNIANYRKISMEYLDELDFLKNK